MTRPRTLGALGAVLVAVVAAVDHAVPYSLVGVTQATLVLGVYTVSARLATAGCVGVVAGAVAEAAATVGAGVAGAGVASAHVVAHVEVGHEVALALGDAGVVVRLADRTTLRGAVTVAAVDGCRRWCWHRWQRR
jgi:hypothetical protein